MFHYRKNRLYCEQVPIEEIALSVGTPVYVYSKNAIVNNLKEYQEAFSSVPTLICYSVKANSNYSILKTIFSCGAGADIVSSGELYRVFKAGLPPEKIVFAGVSKSKEELVFALKKKIFMFNVESVEELKLIEQLASRISGGKSATRGSGKIVHTNKNVKIALRVNPNIDPHTHKYITTGKQENKFGIPYEDALEVFKFAYEKCTSLTAAGMHCHIGSQIVSIKPFEIMSKKIAQLIQKLIQVDIKLEYVNIGGGLGIRYHNEKPPTPKELAETVLGVLKPYKLKLIAEPGRYIVGNAGVLLTKVLYVKHGRKKTFVIVDAGMNDLVRPTLYGAYHEILPVENVDASHLISHKKNIVDIVGPICESSDFLALNREMPPVKSGDLLSVMCAGAYGFAMSSQYNSRRRPAEVLVDKNKFFVIRRRETYRDLLQNEPNPPLTPPFVKGEWSTPL